MQVYDKKRPYINRQILIDLKDLKDNKDLNSTKRFISDLFNSKFLCAMLSRGRNETSEAFSPYILECEGENEGEYVLPIFTNDFEVLKNNNDFKEYTTYLLDFDDILGIYTAINSEMPLSIVIDPYGTNFFLTETMIKIAQDTFEKLV